MRALWLDLPLLRLPVVARRAVIECLRDDAYYDEIRKEIKDVKDWFYKKLSGIDYIHPYKSDTNFIFMRVIGVDASVVRERMIQEGYIFRLFEYDDNQYYRINVAPMETMEDFVVKFRKVLYEVAGGDVA